MACFLQENKTEEKMKAKRTTICIIALIGVFALLVGVPAGAKDDLGVSEAKSDMTKAAEAGSAKAEQAQEGLAQKATMEKINVNEANLSTLTRIKGIGHETAQNIINYRKEVGSFQRLEDLTNVKGIGEKTLEQIKPFITVH
jgi:comEA protein